jgi:hypothetical protein
MATVQTDVPIGLLSEIQRLDELGGGRDAQAALTALIAQAKCLSTAV